MFRLVNKSSEVSGKKKRKDLVERYELSGIYKFQVEFALSNIEHNYAEIAKLEAKLNELKPEMKQIENLTSICGIGDKSAMDVKSGNHGGSTSSPPYPHKHKISRCSIKEY